MSGEHKKARRFAPKFKGNKYTNYTKVRRTTWNKMGNCLITKVCV